MAIALVGSAGTVATGTNSVSPTFAQSTTAGNLLICWLATQNGAPGTPSGWTAAVGGTAQTEVYYKANCGAGETAPTISDNVSTFMAAMLCEFSGAATTSPLDQKSTRATGTTSPQTATAAAVDAASGELVISVDLFIYSMAATKTTSDTYNHATPTTNRNNDATSTANHYRMAWGTTTTNASADSNQVAFTTTNVSVVSCVVVTFKLDSGVVSNFMLNNTMAGVR